MQPFDKIKEYAKTVCDQIKWEKAHSIITEEIENHLIAQRDAYIAEGADEAAATDKAITQMGDPVIAGTQLDHTHRPKPQWGMLALTIALLSGGFIIRLFFFDHVRWEQIAATIIGLGLMAATYFADFTLIGKYPKTIYFSILALSAAVVFSAPAISATNFNPGLLTLLFPLGFAAIVFAVKNKGYRGIILCGFAGIAFLLSLWVIPAASGALLFAISGPVVLCIAISKRWFKVKIIYGYLLVFIPVFIVLLFAFISIQGSYRWEKLQAAFDPSLVPSGAGFIGTQIKAMLNGASLFGYGVISGVASSVPWLGNATDYLLTYLIFNTGWISFIMIMGLLLFFIVKGFILCFRQKSGLALFVSFSIMMTFTMQVIVYVIANLGFQLIAPLSLPLISNGNIATIINLALIGIMLSVFRTGDIVKDKSNSKLRNQNFITYIDGKLIISLSKK